LWTGGPYLLLHWRFHGLALRRFKFVNKVSDVNADVKTFMGVILGSGVVPIALCITWSKANKWGCIGGSIAGFVAGIVAWLVTTSTLNHGVINVVVRPLNLFLMYATDYQFHQTSGGMQSLVHVISLKV